MGPLLVKALEKLFITQIRKLPFCDTGAHRQNGIVETMIGLLTRWIRTILLHAKSKWPQAITTIIWYYALTSACAMYSQLHLDEHDTSSKINLHQ